MRVEAGGLVIVIVAEVAGRTVAWRLGEATLWKGGMVGTGDAPAQAGSITRPTTRKRNEIVRTRKEFLLGGL